MEPCGKKMMMHLSYERYLNGYSPSRKIEFISFKATVALANIRKTMAGQFKTGNGRGEGRHKDLVFDIFSDIFKIVLSYSKSNSSRIAI